MSALSDDRGGSGGSENSDKSRRPHVFHTCGMEIDLEDIARQMICFSNIVILYEVHSGESLRVFCAVTNPHEITSENSYKFNMTIVEIISGKLCLTKVSNISYDEVDKPHDSGQCETINSHSLNMDAICSKILNSLDHMNTSRKDDNILHAPSMHSLYLFYAGLTFMNHQSPISQRMVCGDIPLKKNFSTCWVQSLNEKKTTIFDINFEEDSETRYMQLEVLFSKSPDRNESSKTLIFQSIENYIKDLSEEIPLEGDEEIQLEGGEEIPLEEGKEDDSQEMPGTMSGGSHEKESGDTPNAQSDQDIMPGTPQPRRTGRARTTRFTYDSSNDSYSQIVDGKKVYYKFHNGDMIPINKRGP